MSREFIITEVLNRGNWELRLSFGKDDEARTNMRKMSRVVDAMRDPIPEHLARRPEETEADYIERLLQIAREK